MMSVAATSGLIDAITNSGGNPDKILQNAGLTRAAFSNPDGFIPSLGMIRILEEAARATGDDCFGLHFGERYNPKNLGALTYVVLNSPTVGAAIENAERYLMIHNRAAKLVLSRETERVYIRHTLLNCDNEPHRQQSECSMAVLLKTLRLMVGSDWSPEEVQFEHETPADPSEHHRLFGAPVLFNREGNAFFIERDLLDRQVPAADRRLYRILTQYLDRVLNEIPADNDLVAAIRRLIAESIRNGEPKLKEVAKKSAMTARTLERRLREDGNGFKKLVEDTRRRLALAYLRDRNNTITEIAFLLGYSEVSAFNRAFKRWTGNTPMEQRRSFASPTP
ncbi:MAG TPA: AraC family transcriptional regulator [Candidatus Binatia bacterium]